MPAEYAFFCIVPWAGAISVETRDVDVSVSADDDHPFQKQQLKVPIDERVVLGKMYFARPVRESEWVTIRQLVVDTLKPKRATSTEP